MKLLLFLVLTGALNCAQAQNKNYFSEYWALANEMEQKYTIPACVILAVGYIESGGGVSQVGKRLNNHFGIVGPSKPEISGYTSRYRYYPTIRDSFDGFCILVSTKKFYPKVKGSADKNLWVRSIASTGYAADANKWSAAVIGIINNKCPQ